MSGSARRLHPGARRHAPEAREASNERRYRLLCETDTVLAAIDDLLTATRCQLGRDQGPSSRA